MTGQTGQDNADLARFLQDWIGLWRGAANTPDATAAAALWRASLAAWAQIVPAGHDFAPPRPAPAAASPDARDGTIERLLRRVDALEARIAELEAAGKPRPVRKRRAGG